MTRNELVKLIAERRERHAKSVQEGHKALAGYVEADDALLARLKENTGYTPGICIECEEKLPRSRVARLCIECVPCADSRQKGGVS